MAPEGRIIILPLLAVTFAALAGWVWADQPFLKWLAAILVLLTIFTLQFFRDPQRQLPDDGKAFVSPADGKVVGILPLDYDEHIGGEALQVSIFLSIFNVHVQRVPVDARVDSTRLEGGRFLAAFNPRASRENAQSATHFQSTGGRFTIKQITGLVARRIINYMEPGRQVNRGERLGYSRFGSRVDIILPSSFRLSIKVGDKVKATRSIIGYFEK